MRIQIKDIEFVFSENQQQFIDDIKMLILNNYELILMYLGENKTIDISQDKSNFNDTFHFIVNEAYNNDKNQQAFNDKEFLSALHVEALIRRKKYFNTTIVQQNPNMSDEMLSSLIAYKYFELNGTFDDFVEYLKYRNREDELYQWLQNVSRWDTYNYLLEITSNYWAKEDDEIFKYTNYILSIWLNKTIDIIKNNDKISKEYQAITEKEFDDLFYEFLNYIKAPIEWVDIYNSLKTNGLIIKKDNKFDNSKCFTDNDGVFKIFIGNGNNLKGFCDFVHEFIHYVSRQKFPTVERLSISEFPSIFFEKLSADFLKEKGYSSEIVDQVTNDRDSNNYSLCFSLLPLIKDLIRYIHCGEINKEEKMIFYKKVFDSLNRTRKKMLKIITDAGEQVKDPTAFAPIEVDIEKEVDDECDSMILVIYGYQYLLDSYLAEQILAIIDRDNTVVEKMINVTNNLALINIKNVIELFEIENELTEENIKKLVK